MELNFKNKVVLITGATRGIGRQLAEDFGKSGAHLILTGTESKQIKQLNTTAASLKKKNVQYYCVDFLKESSLNEFIDTLRRYGKIDVCINNAGINRIDDFWNTLTKDWDDIIKVNLRAPYLLSREVSRIMKKNHYGRIINIASVFGVITKEKRSIYSSSKSGIIGLTRAMAVDLAPYNILVNAVSPGFVLTDLTKKILSKSQIRELRSEIPLKKLASPADISKVVLFLASDLNTYMTGQNIVVDGGYVNI